MSELTPQEVLEDLLGSADFPVVIVDTRAAAWIILRRLFDAGFKDCVGRRLISCRKSNVTSPGASGHTFGARISLIVAGFRTGKRLTRGAGSGDA
jgi:hypothetical protein